MGWPPLLRAQRGTIYGEAVELRADGRRFQPDSRYNGRFAKDDP
jgi:hypothetical protein